LPDRYKELLKEIMKKSREPLETKEIQQMISRLADEQVTRSKLLYRLNDLRGEGKIHGKSVGSGKGVWIWWSDSAK
jgi:hypothetical protein